MSLLRKKIMLRTALIAAALLLSGPASSDAHTTNTGYLRLTLNNDSLLITITIDISDLERVYSLDRDNDGTVTKEELLQALPGIEHDIAEALQVRMHYLPVRLIRGGTSFHEDNSGNLFIDFHFRQSVDEPDGLFFLSLDLFNTYGQQYVIIGTFTGTDMQRQFLLRHGEESIRLESSGRDSLGLWKQFYTFILLGIEHIFIGVDHIFFLIGLILLGGSLRDLVKIITAFTLSHSITLILAAMEIVALPARLVESVIALSIMYIAVENFFLKSTEYRWAVAGIFGFVHGFGFAAVLRDIGLPTRGLVSSLLAFNIGVEIGQLAIVIVVLPLIWLVGKTAWRRQVVLAGSVTIFIFGALWFLERAFGFAPALL